MAKRSKIVLSREERSYWLACIARLRKAFKTPKPVVIRTIANMPNCHPGRACQGYSAEYDGHYLVLIDASKDLDARLDALIHEFAHILDFPHPSIGSDEHSETWGVWYSRCYGVVHNT